MMKIYVRATQVSTGGLYPGMIVRDMSDIDGIERTVESVDKQSHGVYTVMFEDGDEGNYDSNDKFEIIQGGKHMKKYNRFIKASSKLPGGFVLKTTEQLEALGFDMDQEFIDQDTQTCEENGLQFVGYAVADSNENAAVIVAKDKNGVMHCYEDSRGRLYEIDDPEDIGCSTSVHASNHALLTSSDGLFTLVEESGVGVKNTPWTGLAVRSNGSAKDHVVEVRLNQNNTRFEGEPVEFSYNGVYVSHGMRGRVDTLEDTQEYINVLQSALDFAYQVEEYLAGNGWLE